MSTTQSARKSNSRQSASKKSSGRYLTTNASKIQKAYEFYKAKGKAGRTAALRALKTAS